MTNRTLLLEHLHAMADHEVKALVLNWLESTEGNLDDLGRLLSDDAAIYGELDRQGQFHPLTEAEMAAQSLQVLEAYKRDRDGVSHDRVSEWLDSLGTENPLPCPQ